MADKTRLNTGTRGSTACACSTISIGSSCSLTVGWQQIINFEPATWKHYGELFQQQLSYSLDRKETFQSESDFPRSRAKESKYNHSLNAWYF
jgi:hypothetical protein